jgi:hypothetical protein
MNRKRLTLACIAVVATLALTGAVRTRRFGSDDADDVETRPA